VTAWLSQGWFDQVRALATELPARSRCSGRIQLQITGGPDGDVACYWVLEEGRPTSAATGAVDSPDVTLSLSWSDAAAIQAGTLDPSVAFMQGRMKVAGSMGLVLELLPAAREPDRRELHRRVLELTDF
jgi:putative sterol carrier protein